MAFTELDWRAINTIRVVSADMVERARSGHPGMCLGAAPMAYVLWTRFMRHDPGAPSWPDRDRFILSAGHGSAMLYCLLMLSGYGLTLEDLMNFRQWASRTPGHPEYGTTPGVECTTGPLGQGFAMGVGMALAERFLAERFNRPGFSVVDHYVYAIVSDGDLMEGISYEAASLAGTLGLGKIIYLYDDNAISIEGSTSTTFTEDVLGRFKAMGWHTQRVDDGNDLEAIARAVAAAREELSRPSIIAVRTHLGYGSPKVDDPSAHGEPLGPQALRATKEFYGWPPDEEFFIPEGVEEHFRALIAERARARTRWEQLMQAYRKAHPELHDRLLEWLHGRLPEGWDEELPVFGPGDGPMPTRVASGKALNAIASRVGNILGGSADLGSSVKTILSGEKWMGPGAEVGRNIHFGVREHAMGAIANGMALHGGVIPYCSTFFVFSDYMRPALRMAALQGCKVIFVFSHDSIGVGEDGPTHQPVEQLMSLRLIPGLVVIRPADANEAVGAWRVAMNSSGPVAIILTRQKVPVLATSPLKAHQGVARGGYVVADCEGRPQILLIGTGSELALCVEAARELEERGYRVRVVSMPSWELFASQEPAYQNEVLPPDVPLRLAVEAGVGHGWERFVGPQGKVLSLERFGASAPAEVLQQKLGFSTRAVVELALGMLKAREALSAAGTAS